MELIGFSMIGSLIGLFYENSILENNNAQIKRLFENISLDLIGIGIIIIFSIKGICIIIQIKI